MTDPETETTAVVKACKCGRAFSIDEWLRLPLLPDMSTTDVDTGEAFTLELRNCPCGSTIGIEAKRVDNVRPITELERSTSSQAHRWQSLLRSFPSLREAPWDFADDAHGFLEWLCSTGHSHGELLAARFVLSVWDPSQDWQELATIGGADVGCEFPQNAARFDLHEALRVWDPPHLEAFLVWAKTRWYP